MSDAFLGWLHSVQLSLIHYLHQYRSEAVDNFFREMAFFDTIFFAFLVVAIVWYGISWRWGLSLALLLVVSDTTNFLLKELFQQPRPATLDPTVALSTFSHYSFPSGGAQQAALLFGAIASWAKKISVWIACLFMILYISFTRVFLGAHFPTDVLGSWLTAAILIALFNWYSQPIANKFSTLSSKGKWLSVFVFSFLPVLAVPSFTYAKVSLFTLATLAGYMVTEKYHLLWEPKSVLQRVSSVVGVVLVLLFLKYAPLPLVTVGKQFLIALWISLGASALFQRLYKQ